jgi:glyoxylase-like metal-dependent hydrolase (beta-lactamase superfamily II)
MIRIAKGVWQLSSFKKNLFNAYLLEDVLVDAGTRWAAGRILSQIRGRGVKLVALTHCHPDHQGSAAQICSRLQIPLACHELEAPAMEGRTPMQPDIGIVRLGQRVWAGADRRVDRFLKEGDMVGGFRVIETPGHSPGHISFFRDSDRVLIAGDVLANVHFFTGKHGLRLPPSRFCTAPADNREAVLRLADLDPAIVCFGHGPPLRDGAELQSFSSRFRSLPRANIA